MPLKIQEPGTLEGEHASVPFHDQAVLGAVHVQLHPVAAFYLERHIIVCGGGSMMMLTAVVMPIHIHALGNHSDRNCQFGRMVIFVPFTNTFYNRSDKYDCKQREHDKKHDLEQIKEWTQEDLAAAMDDSLHNRWAKMVLFPGMQ